MIIPTLEHEVTLLAYKLDRLDAELAALHASEDQLVDRIEEGVTRLRNLRTVVKELRNANR